MNAEGTDQNKTEPTLDELLAEQPPQRPPGKGWQRFLLPAVVVLLLLGGVGWIVFRNVILPMLFAGQMKTQPMPVGVAAPKRATVADSSDYAASLDSRQSVTLQPRVAGQISAIYVRAGDRVEAGTPILQIDAREQRAQVAGQEAAAETAQADIAAARTDVENAQATLRSLQEQRAARAADVQLSQSEYNRYQALVDQGAATRQVLEQRRNALQTSQAALRQAEAEIRAQQSAIAKAQATVVRNQRALERQQATVQAGQAQLQYYTINAPFSGIVGDIPVKMGDYVSTTTQLMRITQNEVLEVQLAVDQEDVPKLRQGLPVQLLDNQNRVLQTGSISFVSPDLNPTTRTVLVKAAFSNQRGQLRTNQFTRARIIWDQRPGVLVPTTAVSRLGGKDFVFVVEPYSNSGCKASASGEAPQGKAPAIPPDQTVAVQKVVTLGKVIGNDQEVVQGLNPNERLIVSGIMQLQNCMPIAAQGQ